MGRRRRKTTRRKPVNIRFVIFQIVVLVGSLLALFAIQDSLGSTTGAVMDSLASEDIDVQHDAAQQDDRDRDDGQSNFPGRRTDDGAERKPATADPAFDAEDVPPEDEDAPGENVP